MSFGENLIFKENLGPQKQFDLSILYLQRVFFYNYFSCEKFDDERQLSQKCGLVSLRSDKEEHPFVHQNILQNNEKFLEQFCKERVEENLAELVNRSTEEKI